MTLTPEERKKRMADMQRPEQKVASPTFAPLYPWFTINGREWNIDLDKAPELVFFYTDETGKKWAAKTSMKEVVSAILWTIASAMPIDFPPELSIEEVPSGG